MTDQEEYVQLVLDHMPDRLSEADIIKIMGVLITSFVEGPHDASTLLTITHGLCMQYYAETGTECMCDECVAHRKQTAH